MLDQSRSEPPSIRLCQEGYIDIDLGHRLTLLPTKKRVTFQGQASIARLSICNAIREY